MKFCILLISCLIYLSSGETFRVIINTSKGGAEYYVKLHNNRRNDDPKVYTGLSVIEDELAEYEDRDLKLDAVLSSPLNLNIITAASLRGDGDNTADVWVLSPQGLRRSFKGDLKCPSNCSEYLTEWKTL